MGGAERQRRDEAECLARATAADRDVRAGVPPVDLADLARPVRRSLIGPRGEVRRADLGEVLLEDCDPAPVSVGSDPLADDRRAGGRVGRQELGDPLGERVELRACPGTNIARWLTPGEEPVDRVATDAEAPGDGRPRQSLAMEEPMNLGPVLHLMHSFLPRHELLLARGCQSIGSGVLRFRPAECAQFWTGVDTRVAGSDLAFRPRTR